MAKPVTNAAEALADLELKANVEYYIGKEAASMIRKACAMKPVQGKPSAPAKPAPIHSGDEE